VSSEPPWQSGLASRAALPAADRIRAAILLIDKAEL
jgi:hypothetical protein